MKTNHLIAGLAVLATGTVVGVASSQFASADVSSGDRPVLVPIDPCRLMDTRSDPQFNVGPRDTPLGPAETYQVDSQEPGTECTGAIPTSASALALNVTAPSASGESFITLWSEGARPNTSTLNPLPGELVFNAATVNLAGDNSFLIYNNANQVEAIIDVVGYYEHHNHDDRYYTQAEVDQMLPRAAGFEAVAVAPADPPNDIIAQVDVATPSAGQIVVNGSVQVSDDDFGDRIDCALTLDEDHSVGDEMSSRFENALAGEEQESLSNTRTFTVDGTQPITSVYYKCTPGFGNDDTSDSLIRQRRLSALFVADVAS